MRYVIGVAGYKYLKNVVFNIDFINLVEYSGKDSHRKWQPCKRKINKYMIYNPKYCRAREILQESVQTIG